MTYRAYTITEDGGLKADVYIFGLHQLQYFRGKLKGQERFLKYLSQYIKSNDEQLDWIINVYEKFRTEAEAAEYSRLFGGWYMPLE